VQAENIQDGAVTGAKLGLFTSYTAASGNTTLTQAGDDVPGCTYTAEATGTYLVHGVFQFSITVTGIGAAIGSLAVDGAGQSGAAIYNDSATGQATVAQNWIVDVTEGDVIKLSCSKFSAGGTASCGGTHTTMTILQIG
jgi:hypothetical protein